MVNRTAESVIRELVAGNQHDAARVIQQALGKQTDGTSMRPLERNRADKLLTLISTDIVRERIVLRENTSRCIDTIVREHRNAQLLRRSGLTPVQKILFWGPPGCGKTLTAKFLGAELGLPVGLLKLHAAITSFVGETAANLNQAFARAADTPMLLLLDEVDAIAKARDDKNDVGELKRVVNSLLQAVDDFNSDKSVIIACSNHQYLLDPAVWRRFDMVVHFPMPSHIEIRTFLRRMLSGIRMDAELSATRDQFRGLSYADAEKIVTRALKIMVLDELPVLPQRLLLDQMRVYKEEVALARKQRPS